METQIKVLTLNCWGVYLPFNSPYRHERIDAIGRTIAKEDYDIVILEEVWAQSDFAKLQARIGTVMTECHFFHSGMVGSGVCVFSRHPIIETFQHQYTLNGYIHKLHQDDWVCGKLVGLVRILCHGYRINVYATHLIAQYDEAKDDFLVHRITQAYEMGQFIKTTSQSCDLVIAAGDLNLQPKDLGYKLIIENACLQDAWLTQEAEVEDKSGATCDRPDNMFHCKHTHTYAPEGMRLDYILYKPNQGIEMKCKKCYMTMRKVPDTSHPYSDHEGLAAVFTLRRSERAPEIKRNPTAIECSYTEALPILDQGMKKAQRDQVLYIVLIVLGIIALCYTSNWTLSWELAFILAVVRIVLTFVVGYSFWMALVLVNWEMNALLATRKGINNILKANLQ